MTRPVLWDSGAWLLAAGGIGALLWAVAGPLGERPHKENGPRSSALGTPGRRAYVTESLSAIGVGRDLFRAERRPAAIPYDPARAVGSGLGAIVAKPTLTLRGLVWGAVPEAVVEGLPGTDGPRVLRVGEAIGGLRVQRVQPDRVIIAGMDTVWTLTLRRP